MDIQSISAQDVGSKIDGQKSQATASDSATATLNQQLSELMDTAKSHFSSMSDKQKGHAIVDGLKVSKKIGTVGVKHRDDIEHPQAAAKAANALIIADDGMANYGIFLAEKNGKISPHEGEELQSKCEYTATLLENSVDNWANSQ
ncbi:hypothetical protein [Simkania sp.]|uniref:hypothetical protein n=1 Tax=Simkania sp. TaxID=34094 RepID=UPI003B524CDA